MDGSHVVVKKNGDGEHSIHIDSARKEDAGVYTVKAKNDVGQVSLPFPNPVEMVSF